MKRIVSAIVFVVLAFSSSFCQELLVNGIKNNKFHGVVSGGDMEQYMYTASFITPIEGKKNFLIKHVSPQVFVEEQKVELELPESYVLKTSSFAMNNHFLIFYDENKKEDVFITVEGENISKKKTSKHTNDTYIAIITNNSEDFVYATVDKKGNYKLTMIDIALQKKWEKSFSSPSGTTWNIISIKGDMDGISILRKENKSDNKYAFTKHVVSISDGNDMFVKTLGNEDFYPYPTFISSKEGMSFTGGFYYNNGIQTGKPDGVYFALLSPDCNLEQTSKVPFSQVIEDIKNTSGSKLLNDNTSICFLDGYMSHETQSFILIGQLFTSKKTEQGVEIQTGEIITVEFSMEQQYIEATATKIDQQTIKLNGDFEGVNNLDLGIWMKHANLFSYKMTFPSPGYPMIGYITKNKNEPMKFCFKNVGIKQDTAKTLCDPVTKFDRHDLIYEFKGNKAPIYPSINNKIILDHMNPMSVISCELEKDVLYLTKVQTPNLEGITIHRQQQEENTEPEIIEEESNSEE